MNERVVASGPEDPFAGLPFRLDIPEDFVRTRPWVGNEYGFAFVRTGLGARQEAFELPRIEVDRLDDSPPPTREADFLTLYEEFARDFDVETVKLAERSIAGRDAFVLEATFKPFDNGLIRGAILGKRRVRFSMLFLMVPGLPESWGVGLIGADMRGTGYEALREPVLSSIQSISPAEPAPPPSLWRRLRGK